MRATWSLQRLQICHDFFDIGIGVLFCEQEQGDRKVSHRPMKLIPTYHRQFSLQERRVDDGQAVICFGVTDAGES
jgi:hypothetical protein